MQLEARFLTCSRSVPAESITIIGTDTTFSVTGGACSVERGCQPVSVEYVANLFLQTGWQPRSTIASVFFCEILWLNPGVTPNRTNVMELFSQFSSKFHSHFAAVNTICIMRAVVKVQCRKKRHKLHRFCTVSAPFFK